MPNTQISSPIILFDGVCNFCNSSVQFIIKRDPNKIFRFASLQSPIGQEWLRKLRYDTTDFHSIILIKDEQVYERSTAVLHIVKELNGFWPYCYVFRYIPRFFRDGLYMFVAKYRYRIFGQQESCMIPTKEVRGRFLE